MRKTEATEDTVKRLNREMQESLSHRRGSFFFPEFNGPDDPHGLSAFHEGDLHVTDGHIDNSTRMRAPVTGKTTIKPSPKV